MSVLDAANRAGLDPHRHADKPLGAILHGPGALERAIGMGALHLDDPKYHADPSIVVPPVLRRAAAQGTYSFGMLDNDQWGCCVAAAVFHILEMLRLRFGLAPTPWLAKVALAWYFAARGLAPCPPGGANDTGMDPVEAAKYWQTTGPVGHTLVGFGVLSNGSPNTRRYIYEMGAVMFAVALATQQQSQGVDWVYEPGEQCGSWGGHAIASDEFDENGYGIESWGEEGTMDNEFEGTCGELVIVPLSHAAIGAGGVGPGGSNFAQMLADLGLIPGGVQ